MYKSSIQLDALCVYKNLWNCTSDREEFYKPKSSSCPFHINRPTIHWESIFYDLETQGLVLPVHQCHRKEILDFFWACTQSKWKSPPHKSICTTKFTGALFIIAKIWKQPKWPSVDEYIKKLRYIIQQNRQPQNEQDLSVCHNMNDTGGQCAMWTRKERKEKYWMTSLTCEDLKKENSNIQRLRTK